MTDALLEHLDRLATVPVLLVASDYDGTLAPLVNDPAQALAHREAVIALRTLASLPQSHVAIISGRALTDLARLIGAPEDIHLVGSHGGEFDVGFATSLPDPVRRLRDQLELDVTAIAARYSGVTVEIKPAAVALHYRNADESTAEQALHEILSGPAVLEGVFTRHGKKVVELSAVDTNKGLALQHIRHRVGATAVLFIGDDLTDEAAFATLSGPDVGVKVGPGATRAGFRVSDPDDVARILARLSVRRSEWLAGDSGAPIENLSFLSDQRTAAIVTPFGRVIWACLPRLDSPALFAELLGGPTAGYFLVAPRDAAGPARQRYREHSLVLETQWKDVRVTDFLDCTGGRPGQRAGRSDLVRVLEGTGAVVIEFAPRLDFGRAKTSLRVREGGLEVEGTLDPIVLLAPGIVWDIREEAGHHTARAEVLLDDRPLALELRYGTGSLRPSAQSATERLRLTDQFWGAWARALTPCGLQPEQVRRSALILKGLCYGPTGAIAAAATTSLPEHVGGVRNWDYRYCWLRDAALAASALVKLGSTTEGMQFLDYVLGLLESAQSPERLQPLYTVTGGNLAPEAEIAELSGYRGSRPVRVGNAAARQVQLDVFGPIVQLLTDLAECDAPLSSQHWRITEAMVEAVERRWQEPDHGIWEIRHRRRHHVHSKVMCWATVDRAVAVEARFLDRRRPSWEALRGEIAEDILDQGYKPSVGAFTAAYDGDDLDAAALHVGLSGLLPPDDPRFVGTVEAVERHLRRGPAVFRYRCDDGLPGGEGAFHLCTAWLIDAYARIGRLNDALGLFNDMIALIGATGVLSEQIEPRTRAALGNTPQAYSHIGVIESALRLSRFDCPPAAP